MEEVFILGLIYTGFFKIYNIFYEMSMTPKLVVNTNDDKPITYDQ